MWTNTYKRQNAFKHPHKCVAAHANLCNRTTHSTAPACLCMCETCKKQVTVGHSQEPLIRTGSAAIEVRGHVGQRVEVSKPITGQCVAEGPSSVKWAVLRWDKRSREDPTSLLYDSASNTPRQSQRGDFSHAVFHQVAGTKTPQNECNLPIAFIGNGAITCACLLGEQ